MKKEEKYGFKQKQAVRNSIQKKTSREKVVEGSGAQP